MYMIYIYIVNATIPAYGRHRNLLTDGDRSTNTELKKILGGGEKYRRTYGGMDKRTDIPKDKGEGGTFQMSTYHPPV